MSNIKRKHRYASDYENIREKVRRRRRLGNVENLSIAEDTNLEVLSTYVTQGTAMAHNHAKIISGEHIFAQGGKVIREVDGVHQEIIETVQHQRVDSSVHYSVRKG